MIRASDGTTVTWNGQNMPVHMANASTSIDRAYVGEEVWKKVDGGTTTYYLPSMRIENGAMRKYYGAFAERDLDGTLKFYHSDHLGSSTLVTKNGTPVYRAAFYPYGEKVDGTERFANASMPFEPKYTFNSKEEDSLAYYDYGARMYDPATGRFISADTSSEDGFNRYAYVRNNPLAYTDPTGHSAEDPADANDGTPPQSQPTAQQSSPSGEVYHFSVDSKPAFPSQFDMDIAYDVGTLTTAEHLIGNGAALMVEPLLACGMGEVSGCLEHLGFNALGEFAGPALRWATRPFVRYLTVSARKTLLAAGLSFGGAIASHDPTLIERSWKMLESIGKDVKRVNEKVHGNMGKAPKIKKPIKTGPDPNPFPENPEADVGRQGQH
jgi:RHS repeat-associated protein